MTDKLLVLVNCASAEEATMLAEAALDRQLAACATVGAPVESLYSWQGRRERSGEVPLTLKTRQDLWPALEAEIRRLHSYDVPEILALPVVAGSADYLTWMDELLAQKKAIGNR